METLTMDKGFADKISEGRSRVIAAHTRKLPGVYETTEKNKTRFGQFTTAILRENCQSAGRLALENGLSVSSAHAFFYKNRHQHGHEVYKKWAEILSKLTGRSITASLIYQLKDPFAQDEPVPNWKELPLLEGAIAPDQSEE
jgi:hypothetical protein